MIPSSPAPQLVTLVRAAVSGDTAALEHFLAEVHPMLRRYAAHKLGEDRDIPSDVAQEALIRIAMGLSQARAESDEQVIAWCLAVVRHLCIDWLRRLHGEPSYRATCSIGYGLPHGEGSDDLPSPEMQHLYTILSMCEAELPLATRSILYLRIVEHAPWTEVADELGIPVTAAKRRYQRAQRSLCRSMICRIQSLPEPLRHAVLDRMRDFGILEEEGLTIPATRSPGALQERQHVKHIQDEGQRR